MVLIFFSNYLILIYIFFSGLIFSKLIINKDKRQNNCEVFFIGFIFLSILSLLLNFFMPLNKLNNTILTLILFFLFLFKFTNLIKIYKKNLFIISIVITLISSILLYKSNIFRPDAGLYHLPFIKTLNEEKIVFGLSNIHSRFGHVSITQFLSAHFNNYLIGENGISIPHAILASVFLIYLFFEINKFKKYNLYFLFIFFAFLFSTIYLKRYSEYGNDAPGFIFSILTIISYLKYRFLNKEKKYFYLSCLFAIYAFCIKSFLIVIVLVPILLINFKEIKKVLFDKKIYLFLFIILIWSLKNIINTGCIIYPVHQLCFKVFIWSDIEKTKYSNIAGEAASKGYSDKIKFLKKNNYLTNQNTEIEEYQKFNKNFNWVEIWSKNHLIKILEKIFLFLLLIFLYYIVYKIYFLKKIKNISKKNILKNFNSLYLISFLGILIWFLKFPVYRFGVPFIYLIIILSFFNFINSTKLDQKNLNLHNKIMIVFFAIFIILINSVRIIKDNDNSNWPNIYKMGNKVNYTDIVIDKKIAYTKADSECMYGKSLCANENTIVNFTQIYRYKFFLKNSNF
jgi:hypothetical protein